MIYSFKIKLIPKSTVSLNYYESSILIELFKYCFRFNFLLEMV